MLRFMFLLISCSLLVTMTACAQAPQKCFDDTCYKITTVSSDEDRRKGLQDHTHLPKDEGMLFVFEKPGRYGFWMKDVEFPIDMLWLDENLYVVHIEHNVPPCKEDPCPSYYPQQKAMYVLELAAGQAKEHNIRIGDVLE